MSPLAFITGANAGIGFAIAKALAMRGFELALGCRDPERGRAALSRLRSQGARAELITIDLTRRASVLEAARGVNPTVLVCNAAAWSVRRTLTASGHELAWATNVLGHHMLVRELAERSGLERIVIVASGLAHSLDMSDTSFDRRPYRGVDAYAQSKQANRMLTREYARRWPHLAINSMHPGFTRTGAFAKGGGLEGHVAALGALLFGRSPERSADTAVWLASDPATRAYSGAYFQDRRQLSSGLATEAQERALFDLCERQVANCRER
jgi:NAD(P)-dependent dehydrogenase (short-subunit alcohol dehydrogenase family)